MQHRFLLSLLPLALIGPFTQEKPPATVKDRIPITAIEELQIRPADRIPISSLVWEEGGTDPFPETVLSIARQPDTVIPKGTTVTVEIIRASKRRNSFSALEMTPREPGVAEKTYSYKVSSDTKVFYKEYNITALSPGAYFARVTIKRSTDDIKDSGTFYR